MGKILVLTSRFPFPLEKGDKLRIFNQIKELSVHHDIYLVALDINKVPEEMLAALRPFCKSIRVFRIGRTTRALNLLRTFFSRLPLQVGLFYKRAIHRAIDDQISELQPNAIYCHLIRMSEYIRKTDVPLKTIDYMDAFSLGMKRRAAVSNPILKALFTMEYRRLRNYERSIFDTVSSKVIISTQDRDAIDHPEKEKIHVVPNGVDFSIFFPSEAKKKYHLLFSGNMAYPPNIEAAEYAATRILPLIRRTYPEVTLLIAGINPPARIRRLASPAVIVRDDFSHIREAFDMSRILLAPMLISIGLQNKILQAMAMKLPCVVSSQANNAIQASQDEICVADTPEEFATACLSLITEAKRFADISENAFSFVHRNYNWTEQNKKLEKILLS